MNSSQTRPAALLATALLVASACGESPLDGSVAADAGADGAAATSVQTFDPQSEAAWAAKGHGHRLAGGVGEMVSADNSARLELAALRVDARLAGDVVAVEVEHVFHNPSDEVLEGTFRFPMPQEAILTGLALQIGDRLVEGELVERTKARQTYEAIVDAMRDPALLEWEAGNRFKLRVFPIEARADKRVVLRYLTPLDRGAAVPRFVYATAAPGMAGRIGHFQLRFDGRTIRDGRDVAPGEQIVVALPATPAAVHQETRPDGTYTAIALRPRWRQVLAAPGLDLRPRSRRVAILLDTSRSALEHKELAHDTLKAVLRSLESRDRFMLLATDLHCRRLTETWQDAGGVSAALAAAAAYEVDGASDLGAALTCAAEAFAEGGAVFAEGGAAFADAGARSAEAGAPAAAGLGRADQLIYIGDGVPTWGEIDPGALVQAHIAALAGVEPHAALLGRGADEHIFRRLADALGGRALRLRTAADAEDFGRAVARAIATPRLRQAFLRFEGGEGRPPLALGTLFAGDSRTVLIRTPLDRAPPTAVSLFGSAGWSGHVERFDLRDAVVAEHVATRWARRQIAAMERDGVAAEHIVRASLQWGVMSRHTSLLVLENDEAWRKHGIERKKANVPPKVSGGDLESLAGGPSLSPDRIQPGDPEIRIPAPEDAREVTIILPWGETLDARYERDEAGHGAWVARFLIDNQTPDGIYQVLIRVTHRHGGAELLRLPFTVDTRAPKVRARIRPKRGQPGTWQLRVQQIITSHELSLVTPAMGPAAASSWRRKAQVAADAKGVEVRFPDGQIVALVAIRKGFFRGDWTPTSPPTWPLQLEVFAIDTALNQAARAITIQQPERVR